ncbi:hypothetical protein [Lysobacter sp.]|uniref:hypothetical protein n=1 Tax=Lysobacter sp. TaxID=72226 RepID=UPI002D5B99E7|nr:hypothetical protein [Lysobacter sp.]HZX78218.1 hypothetical protein [Lysobacter sp.]
MRVDIAEIELNFGLAPFVGERLAIQMERATSAQAREQLVTRLQMAFERAIGDLIDRDLSSPTADQVEKAVQIARTRLISIPGEALRYRGTMELFLARHLYRGDPD